MRIRRSDDEQIVSAHDRYLYGQNNNLYYNQQNNSSCAYDTEIDFSYSDKEFMNELAKDRAYGTSNIRPISKDHNSFTARMYKDAIEESSRIKTMGYFNKFPQLKSLGQPPIFSKKALSQEDNKQNVVCFDFSNTPGQYDDLLNTLSANVRQDIEAQKALEHDISNENKQETPMSFSTKAIKPACQANIPANPNNIFQTNIQNTPFNFGDNSSANQNNVINMNFNIGNTHNKLINEEDNQLQIRDFKKKKNDSDKKRAPRIIGRICMVAFMIISILLVYLYLSGKLPINI